MKSFGKLIYEPKTHIGSTKNWLIVKCDEEFSKYYIKIYEMGNPFYLNGKVQKIIRPVLGPHISIIRGETIESKNWKHLNNTTIHFDYEPGIETNGEYFWLKVKCDALLDLREAYGLPREPKFGLHLTIGRNAFV